MTERPLSGRSIVTTRDRPGRLDSELSALGADVIHVPLIRIEPAADGGARLDRALDRIADFDWVVVTSHHGAALVADIVANRPDVRLAAVGPRTAAVLEAAGREVDLVPERHTAADLVASMTGGSGRVLVAQADRADDTVGGGLADAGFDVEVVTAYRTVLLRPSEADRDAALAADALVLASGSAARAWSESIGPTAPPVVAAIGPSTAAAATHCGLKVTHVSADQHIEGLVDVVLTALTAAS